MFRSVLRPSSGICSRTLRNYYVSACLLRRIPVCGGMLSVCVYLRCTCRCGVWMFYEPMHQKKQDCEQTWFVRSLQSQSLGGQLLETGRGLFHLKRRQEYKVKVKVKCTFLQALRLCTGRTAHRGSRGIAQLFHNHGPRSG